MFSVLTRWANISSQPSPAPATDSFDWLQLLPPATEPDHHIPGLNTSSLPQSGKSGGTEESLRNHKKLWRGG